VPGHSFVPGHASYNNRPTASRRRQCAFRRIFLGKRAPPYCLTVRGQSSVCLRIIITVRRNRTIWLLALLAILSGAVAPQALATWVCEGRACGTTRWVCCCLTQGAAEVDACPDPYQGTVQAPEGSCPSSDCQCQMTLAESETGATLVAPTTIAPVWHVTALPPGRVVIHCLPTEKIARTAESRGPPRPIVAFASPLLRAPPVA
jgi:hypothetical protein